MNYLKPKTYIFMNKYVRCEKWHEETERKIR